MRFGDETSDEISRWVSEIREDADRLNARIAGSDVSEELKHMAAALADKIDGLSGLL